MEDTTAREQAIRPSREFVAGARARLLPALAAFCGMDRAEDAVGEALAYAWENWSDLAGMQNPVGYLYRVGQTAARRSASRDVLTAFPPVSEVQPDRYVDPDLPAALAGLTEQQRTATFLHVGVGWTLAETAELMDISVSSVRNHVRRGLASLRRTMDVD